ncbi:MAG: DUF5701 family protein, partial [Patescibacteria group bacterium]
LQKAVLPESEINPETLEKLEKEFDRQVENLINKGYAKAAELSDKEFRKHIMPLKDKLRTLEGFEIITKENHIPFVVVIKNKLASLDKQILLMEVEESKKGFTGMNLSEINDVDKLEIPDNLAYMIIDVENGKEMQGKSVDDATELLEKQNRTGLTTEEGIALIVQYPEILKDHYIDLSGSRCHASDRVPSLKLSEDEPRLFWSNSGSAFSKWGSASCGSRIGF